LRQNNHPLQIITNHADQPWELMHDGEDFLCLRHAVGRMPAMQREPVQPAHPTAPRARFLLIADPTCDLPGSREEITAIADMLAGHAEVTRLVGTDATIEAFINRLIDTNMIFDVIHYAGHAKFEAGRPSDSTLRLHNGLIYAGDIERALSFRPVVFLNACQASQQKSGEFTGGYLGSYTEGLVTSFLLGGARGCIGPLWSVPDGAARDFAVHFYQRLLDGDAIGEALRDTRNHMRQRAPKDSIWAAYVLHGDPTLKLLS